MLLKLRRCCFFTSTIARWCRGGSGGSGGGSVAATAMWVMVSRPAPSSLALLRLSFSAVSKRPSSNNGLFVPSRRRWSSFSVVVRANEHKYTTTTTGRSTLPHPQVRCYSTTSKKRQDDDLGDPAVGSRKSSADQHQLFLEQLSELNQERESLFGQSTGTTTAGVNDPVADNYNDDDIQVTAARVIREASSRQSITTTSVHDNSDDDDENNETTAVTELEALKNERQELFGFTKEEEASWSSAGGTHKHAVDFLQEIEQARREMDQTLTVQQQQQQQSNSTHASTTVTSPRRDNQSPSLSEKKLTHVADDGQSVHMVDVGAKEATRRTATAESIVVFPDEVLEAFGGQHPHNSSDSNKSELIGPKGPIFSTATLAGIMAAKQTSNLIPLCHPLPLEQVTIDIQWRSRNTIAIQCCCRVTHKTGVEMEALTGATIAALTVYDMVKAVSHNVEIQQTRLLHKDGGKRSVDKRQT